MKRIVSYPVLLFILFVLYTSSMPVVAQPIIWNNWMKYPNNPVLDVGPPGAWDSWRVNHHDVNFDGSTYQLWYTGYAQPNISSIGYASSSNGIDWNKLSDPVLEPSESGWDSLTAASPVVIFDGSIYKMWYGGGRDVTGEASIGYATSPDGISWTKYGTNPVMQPGPPGAWDDLQVLPGTVIFDGSIYKMWYAGNRQLPLYRIGYATSPDGITWQKHPNPVLTPGNPGEWDDFFVYTPEVVFHEGTYHMWYLGRSQTTPGRIGYATSQDGINWVKDPDNPVLTPGPPGSWESNNVAHPRVIIADTIRMWYAGNNGSNVRIGLAIDDPPTGISDIDIAAIKNFSLSQNYPNPFNPTTSIDYTLSKASPVTLKIFNLLGQEIRTLVNEQQSAGTKTVVWDGRDHSGRQVSSGIYVYQLQAGNAVQSRKMLLVR